MALLKTKEIKGWSDEERAGRLKELRNELMRERGIAAMGGAPISPGKIRAIRTNIARIRTVESDAARQKPAARRGVRAPAGRAGK